MTWIKFLTDSESIRRIYGDNLPTLKNVTIHEISICRDEPFVTVRFDFFEYPKIPPKKWSQQNFNRVQTELMAAGVEHLKIEGWDGNSMSDICIQDFDKFLLVDIKNPSFNVRFYASHLTIKKIIAYQLS